jgi:hypothetical protein
LGILQYLELSQAITVSSGASRSPISAFVRYDLPKTKQAWLTNMTAHKAFATRSKPKPTQGLIQMQQLAT